MTNTAKRDWFRILRDLKEQGVSTAEVSRKCFRNLRTAQRWSEGHEPKETDARIVLALYAKHCPQKYREHQAQFEIAEPVEAWTPEQWLQVARTIEKAVS